MEIYSLFQVSEFNEMIILIVLVGMFFVIIYDILTKFLKFNKGATVIIAMVISIFAILSGITTQLTRIIVSITATFGAIGISIAIALIFVAFALIHLGIGKIGRR
jgi:hypothetical protein